jgi:hypothetical protein
MPCDLARPRPFRGDAAGGEIVSRNYINEATKTASVKALLLEMARPDLYRHNAFRVLNLPTRATDRDIQKYLRRIQLKQKFGDGAESGAQTGALRPLPLVPPPGAEMLADAQTHLADAERRLINEFFWFWSEGKDARAGADHFNARATPEADEALLALSRNDLETARLLWTRQLSGGQDRHGIAAHNLAVMFHVAALDIEWATKHESPLTDELRQQRDSYWRSSIEMWRQTLSSEQPLDYLSARAEEMNDPRLNRATVRQLCDALPVALLMINARLGVSASEAGKSADAKRHAALMREFAFAPEMSERARQYVLEPLRHRIYDLCQTMEREARGTPERATQMADQLLVRTRPLLLAVDDLLPAGDPQRADVLDAVALAVNEAALVKSQSLTHGSQREWESTKQLLERVSRYAASPALRARINEILGWVQDNARYSVYKSCWFCSEREGTGAYSVIERMYQNVGYKKYEYYDVIVPRCDNCYAVHTRVEKFTGWFGVLGGLLGLLLGISQYLLLNEVIGNASFWAAGVIIITLVLVGANFGNKQAWKTITAKTKPKKHKGDFPTIKELVSKGWTNQKPA